MAPSRSRIVCDLFRWFAFAGRFLSREPWILSGLVAVLPFGTPRADTVFRVSTSADSGPGSLRQAILDANDSPGKDTIQFRIPGNGTHSITLRAALPQVVDPLEIDGTTQPGYSGLPVIELNGSNAPVGAHGLLLLSGGCSVRGLVINRFSGDGIHIESEGGNVIQGNFLGIDFTGKIPRGNQQGGVSIFGSSGNWIGGTNTNQRNLISGGNKSGIYIVGPAANSNVVVGNLIGTDISGRTGLSNVENGVVISAGIANRIGGVGPGEGNVISGNGESGIYVLGKDSVSNWIQGNLIGTDITGTNRLGNVSDGITVNSAAQNMVGGSIPQARNVISGNGARGIYILNAGAVSNWVAGNFIGTDSSGRFGVSNSFAGIAISGTYGNQIGGVLGSSGNLISGNGQSGVALSEGAFANAVSGNLIGTDVSGTFALGNRLNGISISGPFNLVGGPFIGLGNVISGNWTNGIYLSGTNACFNQIQGNHIGTDLAGVLPLANLNGIGIVSAPSNHIGGIGPKSGNLISANSQSGVYIYGAGSAGNILHGNFIGCDASGTKALGNIVGGVYLYGAPLNLIGGTAPGAGNLISGNFKDGIAIGDPGAVSNMVQGNLIGPQIDGSSRLGNQWHNVEILNFASNNIIGGLELGAPNRIGYTLTTGYDGVRVRVEAGCTGNVIRGNSIFSNAGLGIDLGVDGPSTTGLPVLTSCSGRYRTRLVGTVSALAPTRTFTLDCYVNTVRDPSGYGEGERWIYSTSFTTDNTGKASFSPTFPDTMAVVGNISCTVTDDSGTTSELGADVLNSASPVQDTDNDGMPDEYENAWGLNANDATDAGQDLDGDGLSNLMEFRAGTNPRDPNSALRLDVLSINEDEVLLSFPTVIGLSYTVQAADSLSSDWEVLASKMPGTGGFLVVSDGNFSSTGTRFYQLLFQ